MKLGYTSKEKLPITIRKNLLNTFRLISFFAILVQVASCNQEKKAQPSQRETVAKARKDQLLQKYNAIEFEDTRGKYTIDLQKQFKDRVALARVEIEDVIEGPQGKLVAIATTYNTIFRLRLDRKILPMLDTSRYKSGGAV